jgi:hypothetical protein
VVVEDTAVVEMVAAVVVDLAEVVVMVVVMAINIEIISRLTSGIK